MFTTTENTPVLKEEYKIETKSIDLGNAKQRCIHIDENGKESIFEKVME